ncbi:hypothetical protein [Halodurantibacterium flavum]|uniref:Uncharacterized protein n=1 Tax=Halodurantibacterium flavum TaxID=1382802 RepID=A0ABW4S9A1_9RHOB
MKLRADMPVWKRVAIIEEALADVLDRGETMEVGGGPEGAADRCVYVIAGIYSDHRVGHSLTEMARELEALLS